MTVRNDRRTLRSLWQCSRGFHGLVGAPNYADERSFATIANAATTVNRGNPQ